MTAEEFFRHVDRLLEAEHQVIDFLPGQVPEGSPGQFFAAEELFFRGPLAADLRKSFAQVLLKLNCFSDFAVCGAGEGEDGACENPDPAALCDRIMTGGDVTVLLPAEDALITLDADDTHMTVFGAGEGLLALLGELARAHGLFLWKPEQ